MSWRADVVHDWLRAMGMREPTQVGITHTGAGVRQHRDMDRVTVAREGRQPCRDRSDLISEALPAWCGLWGPIDRPRQFAGTVHPHLSSPDLDDVEHTSETERISRSGGPLGVRETRCSRSSKSRSTNRDSR